MKFNRSIKTLLLVGSLLGGTCLIAQDQNTTPAPADNTRMNQRDRDPSQPTADQQREQSLRPRYHAAGSPFHRKRQIALHLRSQREDHYPERTSNVEGAGAILEEEKKRAIEAKAAEVAGGDKVNNELDVKTKQ